MMRYFSAVLLGMLGVFSVTTLALSADVASLPAIGGDLNVVTDVKTAAVRPTSLRTEAAKLYGTGVYACLAGDLATAQTALDQSLQIYKKAPCAWYYRGVVRLRQGDTDGASRDFETGALIEMAQLGQMTNVGRALSQIQGAERQEIERYRQNARRVKTEKYKAWCAARYEALRREEQRVLDAMKADEAAKDAADATAAVDAKNALPEPKMPQGATATTAEPAAANASTTTATDEADPFADDAGSAATDEADPFADETGSATTDEADPFADEADSATTDEADPFADEADSATTDEADPFADESAADDSDPFAE